MSLVRDCRSSTEEVTPTSTCRNTLSSLMVVRGTLCQHLTWLQWWPLLEVYYTLPIGCSIEVQTTVYRETATSVPLWLCLPTGNKRHRRLCTAIVGSVQPSVRTLSHSVWRWHESQLMQPGIPEGGVMRWKLVRKVSIDSRMNSGKDLKGEDVEFLTDRRASTSKRLKTSCPLAVEHHNSNTWRPPV